jgi:hypothetical protein
VTATLHCSKHGAIDVDGAPNQVFKCDICGEVLRPLARRDPELPARVGVMGEPKDLTAQNDTPHTRAERSDKVLHQAAFLAAYAKLGSITKASQVAEVDRHRHYDWMQDADYERRFLEAHKFAIQHMVDIAHDRACGLSGEASDRLMIKFLESIPAGMSPKGWDFNAAQKHEVRTPDGIKVEGSARDALASRIASLATAGDTPSGS